MKIPSPVFNHGGIEIITGTMFSGKSKKLLERGFEAQKSGKTVFYFKPKIDTRDDEIVSRNNEFFLKKKAIQLRTGYELVEHFQKLNNLKKLSETEKFLILVDEVQFFDESIVYATQILSRKGYNIVLSGLFKNYMGQAFGFMPQLIALVNVWNPNFEYARCSFINCDNPGSLPQRLNNGEPDSAFNPVLLIEGSNDKITYEARCIKHHEIKHFEEWLTKKLEETKQKFLKKNLKY